MTLRSLAGFFSAPLLFACGTPDRPSGVRASATVVDAGAGADAQAPTVIIDQTEIIGGVPDRNRDPAVVAIDVGGEALCSGALVSPRLVLTARHCVSRTVDRVACPPGAPQVAADRDPTALAILAGDDVAAARQVSRGVALVTPKTDALCDADVAIIVLDAPVTRMKPLAIARTGVARGDYVRAVGYGRRGGRGGAGLKLVREHVRVLSVSRAEFSVGEATCQGDSGGPAIDEDTGEIVGVVSRGGPSCEGPGTHNVYSRVDAWSALVDEAFAAVGERAGTRQRPPTDVGGPCDTGADCAAGLCVTDGARQYCSRSCGTGDRCPTGLHCERVGASPVCLVAR